MRNCHADQGMSLIEILIALSILATGIMSILALLPSSTVLVGVSNEEETARSAIEAVLSDIRSDLEGDIEGYNNHAFSVEGLTPGKDADAQASVGLVEITDGPDSTKMVTVTVEWYSSNREDMRIQLSTLLAN